MRTSVRGRVKNFALPRSQSLLPLFEAIINAIDAIFELRGDTSDGSITIRILRQDAAQADLYSPEDAQYLPAACGFEVVDTGIGFTDANFVAFNEADTQAKEARGGRGVGRFSWLAAFGRVEVESVFLDGSVLRRRVFEFSLSYPDGIGSVTLSDASSAASTGTAVRLLNLKPEFTLPKKATVIAHRIVEHCLEYFVLGLMPSVIVIDPVGDERVDLASVYSDLVANSSVQTVQLGEHTFDVVHFLLRHNSLLKHQLHYCANRRAVKNERLSGKIANLPAALRMDNESPEYVYAGYVSSTYLDSHVNQQRTDFDTMPDQSCLIAGELCWGQIAQAITAASAEFLRGYTEAARVAKEHRIQDYVNLTAPQYRFIVRNHSDTLNSISPEVSDSDLDTELYKVSRDVEASLRQRAVRILEPEDPAAAESDEVQLERFSEFWEEVNDAGKANLAKYIVHRKLVLSALEKSLNRQSNGRYVREELVHKLIFPLRATSDDIMYDSHNLWILDEKLAYHHYLSSDKQINKSPVIESDADSRPDLLLFFNKPIAVVDEDHPYGSGIVIFEFKRPMREEYDDDENPITQVLGYVNNIKQGRVRTKEGRPIRINSQTPFYCYVVCDFTPKFEWYAQVADLRETPDGGGFFGYNQSFGAYIEAISFTKLLSDAKKRNRVLFDKLNLPSDVLTPGIATNGQHPRH